MSRQPVVCFFPARNEAATVADVVRRLPPTVAGHPVRALVVDDGSTDATAALASAAGARVVTVASGTGLGAAVRDGLRVAGALDPIAVAFCDADGEYAPEDLDRVVAPIIDGDADYVVGSRFLRGRPDMRPHRRAGNRLLTVALRRLARVGLTDGQSGYRALSAAAARAAHVAHDYNYAQVLTLDLVAKGYRYAEVPITYAPRRHGRSFVRIGPYLRNVVPMMWRLRIRPDGSVLDDVVPEAIARV